MVVAESGLFFCSNPTGETEMLTGKLFKTVLTAAAVLALAAPTHASLVARYLDATTGIDAYYDTDLGITWLRDANAGGTASNRQTAINWAATYTLGDVTGWRLPTDPVCATHVNCAGSEWAHLFFTELGNSIYTPGSFGGPATGGLLNPGGFVNWQTGLGVAGIYWSSSTYANDPAYGGGIGYTSFIVGQGRQNTGVDALYFAMAVHDGDVGRSTEEVIPPGNSVPEPESMLLALTALGALALARRRRHG
jgi:MYXO-CTERM domain-containing protein